jgi:Nucleotidyl transferase AbiEii toxin, Type IV TA system
LIDIAQDLLLTRLHQRGVFDHLVFKGGTALRKLYVSNAGRFSTDLDFSVRNPADNPEMAAELLRGGIDGQDIDGFRYSVEDHRGARKSGTKRRSAVSTTSPPSSIAIPAPSHDDLGGQLHASFNFLADLEDVEQRIVSGGAGSRNLVLATISDLPGSRFTGRPLY